MKKIIVFVLCLMSFGVAAESCVRYPNGVEICW